MKKLQAIITLYYDDAETATAVAKAFSPDNLETPPSLTVQTTRKGRSVVTFITEKNRLATFIATIDDLLACASTAEKALHIVKRKS